LYFGMYFASLCFLISTSGDFASPIFFRLCENGGSLISTVPRYNASVRFVISHVEPRTFCENRNLILEEDITRYYTSVKQAFGCRISDIDSEAGTCSPVLHASLKIEDSSRGRRAKSLVRRVRWGVWFPGVGMSQPEISPGISDSFSAAASECSGGRRARSGNRYCDLPSPSSSRRHHPPRPRRCSLTVCRRK